ncbi:MAG: gliding motility lipoprotein GldH [Saprospiraceae bacterium]|nr:gliding motility lipoprotein GldH [Saprospiraceae bacterium]MCB9324423.1 gliding motility lipoprotein GldH [Lewinellaceae bacterium]
MYRPINLLLLTIPLIFFACGSDYAYQKEYTIPEEGWTYQDTLDFTFDIEDTTSIYNLYLKIEHDKDYAFQNLYTKVHTKFPGGERIAETLSLELADKAGGWQGNCSKKSYQLSIPIQKNAFFNATGAYKITLEQFMRTDPVKGLHKIGFMLEKTAQTR